MPSPVVVEVVRVPRVFRHQNALHLSRIVADAGDYEPDLPRVAVRFVRVPVPVVEVTPGDWITPVNLGLLGYVAKHTVALKFRKVPNHHLPVNHLRGGVLCSNHDGACDCESSAVHGEIPWHRTVSVHGILLCLRPRRILRYIKGCVKRIK